MFGFAVLGLVVNEELFHGYPDRSEGDLTKMKSLLVCGARLSEVATSLDLGVHIRMSRSEAATGGRHRSSILADTTEALIGAVYLDRGDFCDALTYLEQALRQREQTGIAYELGETLFNLGETASALGQYDRALDYYLRGLDQMREAQDDLAIAAARHGIAVILGHQDLHGPSPRAARCPATWSSGRTAPGSSPPA